MPNLMDNPFDLIEMSRDELDELLLEKYKNIAMLRELLRRTLGALNTANTMNIRYKKELAEQKEQIQSIKNQASIIIDSIDSQN